jgi:hypothetical protein
MQNVLLRLREVQPSLSSTERQIAQFILDNPDENPSIRTSKVLPISRKLLSSDNLFCKSIIPCKRRTFSSSGTLSSKWLAAYVPGRSEYLNKILNYIVFIGAVGLTVVAIVPILASGLLDVSRISFSGTSLIIIVGVVLETIKAVESQMLVRYYKGFLND